MLILPTKAIIWLISPIIFPDILVTSQTLSRVTASPVSRATNVSRTTGLAASYQACYKQCHTDNQDDDLDCKYSNARAVMELSGRCSLFTDQLTTDDHYTGQNTSATSYKR